MCIRDRSDDGWTVGNNSPVSYVPLLSSVPAEVKSNREMKVTDTVVSFFLRWLRWLVCPSPGSIFPGCFVHGLHWDSMIAVGLLWDYGLR